MSVGRTTTCGIHPKRPFMGHAHKTTIRIVLASHLLLLFAACASANTPPSDTSHAGTLKKTPSVNSANPTPSPTPASSKTGPAPTTQESKPPPVIAGVDPRQTCSADNECTVFLIPQCCTTCGQAAVAVNHASLGQVQSRFPIPPCAPNACAQLACAPSQVQGYRPACEQSRCVLYTLPSNYRQSLDIPLGLFNP